MDHAVVVDANRGVIIDSEEQSCLVILEDVLMQCGGPDADHLEVSQVLRIGRAKELDQAQR